MKKLISAVLCLCLLFAASGCGSQAQRYTPLPGLDTGEKVTLTIAIPYETNKALNTAANAFITKYPNVSIHLQYVEDYGANAVQLFRDNKLDMILQKDILNNEYTVTNPETKEKVPSGTWPEDYFYNFAADTEIDFSGTSPDITDNYRHKGLDKAGNEMEYLYSYPLGGETRGVFVNTTLLRDCGLSVPSNYAEFLACCETLKNVNGVIPIQGGVSTAAYSLGLAPAVNPVVHDEASLAKMAAAESGVSELFADTMSKFYTLATNRYFDYKSVEESGSFTQTSELGQAQSFLGLQIDQTTFEVTTPENNIGYVAFMPYISSIGAVIDSLINEYGLRTEYAFICSPLNDEGASPAYVTPYYGICANKNSASLLWVREFVNFLFQHDTITAYASEAGIIPNTTDAMEFAAAKYNLNADTDIALCGQILFSDSYNGFNPLSASLLTALKCNAQKYMVDLNLDADGAPQYEKDENGREFLYMGNGETPVYKEYVGAADPAKPGYAFCTLSYYMDNMENEFASYRGK